MGACSKETKIVSLQALQLTSVGRIVYAISVPMLCRLVAEVRLMIQILNGVRQSLFAMMRDSTKKNLPWSMMENLAYPLRRSDTHPFSNPFMLVIFPGTRHNASILIITLLP